MPDEQWDKMGALLEEALARPRAERDAFLRERCEEEALREEVASLVELHEEAPAFFEDLDASALASMLGEMEEETPEEEAPAGSQASDPLKLEGTSVGRYRVEEHLGGGGMGVVYRARDTELDRPVALKFLPPHLSWHEEAEWRFLREARAAAALDHSSVATIHEISKTEGGRRFIAMAYYEGETLKKKIQRGPLEVEEALDYAAQIAEGLSQAHAAGIVHRDIKPANVLVTDDGYVKIVDFGIAKLKGGERITKTGDTLGTVAYMAPEQIQGKDVGPRVDLFSLGVVLYEMLTGRHPFPREYRQAIAYQIIHEEAEPPSTYQEDLPAKVDEIVLRCLEKEPTERYSSAEEVLNALQEAMPKVASSASVAGDSASEAESFLSGQGWLKRRRMVELGALAVVVLLVGWWLLGGSAPEEAAEALPVESEPEITERSVAVLPFMNLSAGEEVTSVTHGLHEDLLTRLSNISDLQVISRTSVERYRGTELSLPAIAESLGVRWIVEGGVQGAGGQVQVYAQLIDPETDANVWADRYQQELTAENLFAIQEEIAEEIAEALETELTAGEQERIAGAPTQDLEAYRLYAQGRRLIASRAPDSIRQARGYFERALEQDSSYALAWSGLADARLLHAVYSSESFEAFLDSMQVAIPEAEAEAERALELNPDLAEAHASRAIIYMYEQPERPGQTNALVALRHLRRAVELRPSYAQAHDWLGELQMNLGRPATALEHLRLAVELSPGNFGAREDLPGALIANGKYEEALREARRLRSMYPERARVAREGAALIHLKRWTDVRALAREQRSEADDPPGWTALHLALADAATGDTASARGWIEELCAEGYEFNAALAYAALGELDLAFEALQEIEEWTPGRARVVRYHGPDLLSAAFRADPRYEELIRKINEYWGLNPDGSIPEREDLSAGL